MNDEFCPKKRYFNCFGWDSFGFCDICTPQTSSFQIWPFDVSNSIWSKELQNKPRYGGLSTDASSHHSMSGNKGGNTAGNKVAIRNHKSLKIIYLKVNILKPSVTNKNIRVTICISDGYSCFVELEGFEPSSKRGTNKVSTCLVAGWFSTAGRSVTANQWLIL